MEIELVLDPREVLSAGSSFVGGKAWNLARLTAMGHRVPDWIVVSTQAWLQHRHVMAVLSTTPQTVEIYSAAIHDAIMKMVLDDNLTSSLTRWVTSRATDTFFAVRSSVSGEDSEQFSFAGQMESFLFRQTPDQIIESIKRCWASAFSIRALQYRLQHNLGITDIQPAVIIQEMIDGEVSGVLFTAHPTTGHRGKALLTATYGLGEGIVSGIADTDEFTIQYGDWNVESTIGKKDTRIVFNREKKFGTVTEDVESTNVSRPCLNADQILKIAVTGRTIADRYRQPQDIEWTFHNNELFILQARPITRLPKSSKAGRHIVWDNSNIQESYCGVTTPLTFSFASGAYATVYEATMRLMKIQESVIAGHQDMLHNLLGLIHGRVYYNINNWYRGLLLLPAFKTNKADMERMMGLDAPVDFISDQRVSGIAKFQRLVSLLKTSVRLLLQFRRIARSVSDFHANFRRHEEWVRSQRLHELEPDQLWALTNYLQVHILQKWDIPIVNDFYVMMYHGRLRRHLEKAGIENIDVMQNNLLSGEPDLESSQPTKMLIRIAAMIQADSVLLQRFDITSNSDLLLVLKAYGGEVYDACEHYIKLYGDRVIGELKLETPSLRENPAFMFLILRNYLRDPSFDPQRYHEKESHIRGEAEHATFGTIRTIHGSLALRTFKKDLVKWRSAVRNRESMRLERTRLFGMYRDIFLALGKYMAFQRILAGPRDIFYLSLDELGQWMDGRSVHTDLQSVIVLRKKEFEDYVNEEVPNRLETYGPIYYGNNVEQRLPFVAGESADLKGLGCYPGVVEGEVRLILSPDEAQDLNGHILVTLRTDPGWTPLFPSCKGIIVERGSSLSHSAVIARELGIPTIVAVADITKILKNGDRIQMDGALGVIRKL